MKKATCYQYTVTDTQSTGTRVEKRKASAISKCRAAVKAGEVGTVGVVHFQDEKEMLDAVVKFSKQPDGSILEEKFPLVVAP